MPNAPIAAAPPYVLASQILKHFDLVLARYLRAYPRQDCPVGLRWQAETGSSLADFPQWLAARTPQSAMVKVTKALNAPLTSPDRSIGAEPAAEVLLQMALLALVQQLAQRYAAALNQGAGPLLHLPMLQDAVLALLVACRYGVAVRLELHHDSEKGESLKVTNLITDRQEVQAGVSGVQENIGIELKRLALAQQVLEKLLPPTSALRGHHLPDDQVQAWVDEADEGGLPPIVVLAWDEADLARDIEQRWGVRTALRGDPASAPADSPQRVAALQFADAGLHVEGHLADLAKLLRQTPLAPAATEEQPKKPLVFISYARENLALQQRLCDVLRQYRVVISTWSDQDLQAGQQWKQDLLDKLAGCQVAVLLLSVDFNDSQFIREHEMPEIKRRHAAGQLHVVPVVVGACKLDFFDWVAGLQMPHEPEQELAGMQSAPLDRALNGIAAQIAQIATQAPKDTPA